MNKTLKAVVIFLLAVLATVVIVRAISSITFLSNPVVPTVSDSFTLTPAIIDGSDQTSLWVWSAATNSFSATINIYNTGNTALTPVISHGVMPTDWTFSTSAITAIVPGDFLVVVLTITHGTPPLVGAIGSFTVTIT